MSEEFTSRLERLRVAVEAACRRSGRDPVSVTLIGASKGVSPDRIRQAIDAGIQGLGENYIQEAVPKIQALGSPVPWHFIGHLQRNKARLAARWFDVIQTVDSSSLAESLSRHSSGRRLPILLEVNLSGDPRRPGVPPPSVPAMVEQVSGLPNLDLRGLMGIPPLGSGPEEARPYFRTLKRLWDALHNENREILSMGMTEDFAVAIEEGSTLIRVGTGLFGPRS